MQNLSPDRPLEAGGSLSFRPAPSVIRIPSVQSLRSGNPAPPQLSERAGALSRQASSNSLASFNVKPSPPTRLTSMQNLIPLKQVSESGSLSQGKQSLSEKPSSIEPQAMVNSYNEQTRNYVSQVTSVKTKSKNPFDRMKENSNILSSFLVGDVTWIEWQVEDDGPIFYSKKDAEGGQWDKPGKRSNFTLSLNIGLVQPSHS